MSKAILVNKILARKYSDALYSLAKDNKVVDEVWQDLQMLKSLLESSPKVRAIVANNFTPEDTQENLIAVIIKNAKLCKETHNFLNLLVKNGRLYVLGQIIEAYKKLRQAENNEIEANVISATKLKKAQLDNIAKILEEKYAKKVVCVNNVRKHILGGVVIKVGSQMIDCSLAKKLHLFENESKKQILKINF